MPRKKIAVIGAGPAGLATLAVLKETGDDVVLFERRDRVGGLWNDGYDALHLITPRSVSLFDGYPQPADYPPYPSRDQIVAYMNAFAKDRGLLPHIRFNTEVHAVNPRGAAGMGGWEVVTEGGATSEDFDVVVVANGHLHHKYAPELPGSFDGKVIHSYDYRNAADIDGERVLVIGAGNSGCDLAVDAAAARKRVTVSIRNPFTFLPKSLFGKPRSELRIAKLPPWLNEKIMRILVRVSVGRPEQYPGLPKPTSRNLRKQRPVVNDLLGYWIMHGRITVKPALENLQGKTAYFTDGTSSEVDTIMLATGFRYYAPFLSETVVKRENDMPRRWGAGVLVDGVANLYFVGLIAPLGAQWPVYSIQAGLIRDFIRLQDQRSTPVIEEFKDGDPGFGDLEILRDVWFHQVERTKAKLSRDGSHAKKAA